MTPQSFYCVRHIGQPGRLGTSRHCGDVVKPRPFQYNGHVTNNVSVKVSQELLHQSQVLPKAV